VLFQFPYSFYHEPDQRQYLDKVLSFFSDVSPAPLAYLRFHSRNGKTWWGLDAVARYDYLYSEAELETWADRIKQIAVKADRVLAYFNNH
jgi:uncharacterized protein YecE (DUF72 family)